MSNHFGDILKFGALMPDVLGGLNHLESAYQAFKDKVKATKLGQSTDTEDNIITNEKKNLVNIFYKYIPNDAQLKASKDEVTNFVGIIEKLAEDIFTAIEVFTLLVH